MFTKVINPTFPATVEIPVPGNTPDPVNFTFRAKTLDAFEALVGEVNAGKKTVAEAVREVVDTWTHPAVEFSPEKLDECFQTFPGSALAIWVKYRQELFEGRRKN